MDVHLLNFRGRCVDRSLSDPWTGRGHGSIEDDAVVVFHAGTKLEDGLLTTNGGRVLCVTATGPSLNEARERAYAAYDKIQWDGKFCRRDIGTERRRSRIELGSAEGAR